MEYGQLFILIYIKQGYGILSKAESQRHTTKQKKSRQMETRDGQNNKSGWDNEQWAELFTFMKQQRSIYLSRMS